MADTATQTGHGGAVRRPARRVRLRVRSAGGGGGLHLGPLTIFQALMNPDRAMGDDLRKKTRSGNVLTVFGNPDVDTRPTGDDQLQVEIRGLDVYDPTTGVVRSNSTDDVACWFIDTAHDDQQFFVSHAYFLGADDPYDR